MLMLFFVLLLFLAQKGNQYRDQAMSVRIG